jgi:dTDP-4-dehydrorhamnose 3,5-epimerase
MQINETKIPGCYKIQPKRLSDDRGDFIKTFQSDDFRSKGLCFEPKESYYSTSKIGVLRGLHFQLPPCDHEKLVYCVAGSIEDAAVDLRVGSPTYGQAIVLELSAAKGNMIFLPKGMAHGFCTVKEPATVVYTVSYVHNVDADTGIRWDSAGINWSIKDPITSDRDQKLPALTEFISPFLFNEEIA